MYISISYTYMLTLDTVCITHLLQLATGILMVAIKASSESLATEDTVMMQF